MTILLILSNILDLFLVLLRTLLKENFTSHLPAVELPLAPVALEKGNLIFCHFPATRRRLFPAGDILILALRHFLDRPPRAGS